MRMQIALLVALALFAGSSAAQSSKRYPPLSEYLMDLKAEIALARSAAPANISDHATIKVLTTSGYEVAQQGENGNVCMVMRGFSAPMYTPAQFRDLVYDPAVLAPICFTAPAARIAMPYYEMRTNLAINGKTPDEISAAIQEAYVRGMLPRRDAVTFAYMWSAHQHLGPGIGTWRPHVMIFAPYYENAMVGDNTFGSPFPQVSDDAGTPFTVVVIPVDDRLAIKVRR